MKEVHSVKVFIPPGFEKFYVLKNSMSHADVQRDEFVINGYPITACCCGTLQLCSSDILGEQLHYFNPVMIHWSTYLRLLYLINTLFLLLCSGKRRKTS